MTVSGARPDYGIDAPGLVRAFFAAGFAALLLCAATFTWLRGWAPWGALLTGLLAVVSAYALGMGGYMIYGSRVEKVRNRERLLDLIAWRGDEAVLDVGCGRGLMLVGAARRLATGHAVGIDIWQASDQSANTADGALDNARREGVGERVAVRTADMRALPFDDASFDVVLSHWAVHNLDAESDRDFALSEMARVLKPLGTVLVADIEHRTAYAARLSGLGLTDQRLIVAPLSDAILNIVSFGSFRPAAILARRR